LEKYTLPLFQREAALAIRKTIFQFVLDRKKFFPLASDADCDMVAVFTFNSGWNFG